MVEFKSNRRQATGGSTSIWGDADLKAIARAVESDLPNAGGETDAERAVERPPLVPIPPAARILETIDKPVDQPAAALSGDPATVLMPTPPADAAEPPADTDDAPVVPVPVSAQGETDHAVPVGRRAASKVARPVRKTKAKSDPAAQTGKAKPDDLEALETENRRLKALWRSRLQAENAQLREMLARLPST
ncbi:hypothetical protein [Rhizobium aouanii]|uniref:Transcriptional regulator n=1 Tax=Rhizobium aouanii TaxID=3118145 RepID=A0ABU8CL94_9HYPH